MKKFLKIFLAVLGVLSLGLFVGSLLVPAVKSFTAPFIKWVIVVLVAVVTIFVIIICCKLFNKEVGTTINGNVKYKEDKVREKDVNELESKDIYTNFERAEFAPRIKDTYECEVVSFPESFTRPQPVEQPKVEEKPVEKKPEVKPEVKPVEEKPVEVKPVEEKPVEVKPVAKKKIGTEKVKVFEGCNVPVTKGWAELVKAEVAKKYFAEAVEPVKECYESGKTCYPAKENIMKPFELTDISEVKVVIIGKLPYYRKNQADGLAFSSNADADMNQSTGVIINECVNDVKIKQPANGSLKKWAEQGVFMLNTVLTAPSDKPAAHTDCWSKFTDSIINTLIKDKEPKVFILWGEHARAYADSVAKQKQHLVIEAPNPSPLSAANGFYGSKPFSKTNEFLTKNGKEPIDWTL